MPLCSFDSIGSIEFGSYNGYLTWPYQAVGVTSALLVFGIVFAGALDSRLFNFLIIGEDKNDDDSDSDWVSVEMKEQGGESKPSKTEYSNMDDLDHQKASNEAGASDAVLA